MKSVRRNKVRLYVPSKDRRGKRVSNPKVVAEAETLFARLFGGCTCFDARGTYLGDAGKIIQEAIKLVESSAQTTNWRNICPLCERLRSR